jgi:hypothetical protein
VRLKRNTKAALIFGCAYKACHEGDIFSQHQSWENAEKTFRNLSQELQNSLEIHHAKDGFVITR